MLDAIWQGLERRDEQADRRVREALAAPSTPARTTTRTGRTVPTTRTTTRRRPGIYAAECFADGDAAEPACWAAVRAVDLAFPIAYQALQLDPNDFVWDPAAEPMPFAKEAMHPAVQDELRRQLADLELLQRPGVTAAVLDELKTPAAA